MQKLMRESHVTLPNGLRLHFFVRPNFQQTVAMLSVDFGARDQDVLVHGEKIHFNAGLAHFLEHKIFAQPGYDAFTRLSELGANANAFTTQTRTSYFLSAIGDPAAAIQELLTFTQQPFFETAAVQREADIIKQEIDMYQDEPTTQLLRGLARNLYPGDALAADIAGTPTSVYAITPDELRLAHDLIYRPEQMDFVVVGDIDPEHIKALVEASPAGQRTAGESVTLVQRPLMPVVTEPAEIDLPVVRNKVGFGQRWFDTGAMPEGRTALEAAIAVSLALDLVFGEQSPRYMEWYDMGLIDDSFMAEFDWERGFAYLTILAETPEPDELRAVIVDELEHFAERFAALSADFELMRRDALGRQIAKLDQLEEVVTRFEGRTFADASLMDEIEILEGLTVERVLAIVKTATVSPIATVFARPIL